MINSKVKKSLDTLLPTEIEKKRMLNNIMNNEKKTNKKMMYAFLTFCTAAVFCIFFVKPIEHHDKNEISLSRMRIEKIEYQGKCYNYVGNHDGKNLISTKDKITGGKVYLVKGQDNEIVVYENKQYQKYQLCRGEVK